MNIVLWLHGALGSLDELLACGIGVGLALLVLFVLALRAPKPGQADPAQIEHEAK